MPLTYHINGQTVEVHLGELEGQILTTVRKTGKALGYGNTKVYELIGKGEIRSLKDGKARRVVVQSIGEHVARKLVGG